MRNRVPREYPKGFELGFFYLFVLYCFVLMMSCASVSPKFHFDSVAQRTCQLKEAQILPGHFHLQVNFEKAPGYPSDWHCCSWEHTLPVWHWLCGGHFSAQGIRFVVVPESFSCDFPVILGIDVLEVPMFLPEILTHFHFAEGLQVWVVSYL